MIRLFYFPELQWLKEVIWGKCLAPNGPSVKVNIHPPTSQLLAPTVFIMSPWHFSCSNPQETVSYLRARITHQSLHSPALLAKCPALLVLHQWMNKGTNSSNCLTRVNLNVRKGTHLPKEIDPDDLWALFNNLFLMRICAKQKILSLSHQDINMRSHWLLKSISSPLILFLLQILFSRGLAFPVHSRKLRFSGGPKHGGPWRKSQTSK